MEELEYIVIKDMSAGNESVGEMWQETKIFLGSATLHDVMEWAMADEQTSESYSRKSITLTKPHGDKK